MFDNRQHDILVTSDQFKDRQHSTNHNRRYSNEQQTYQSDIQFEKLSKKGAALKPIVVNNTLKYIPYRNFPSKTRYPESILMSERYEENASVAEHRIINNNVRKGQIIEKYPSSR